MILSLYLSVPLLALWLVLPLLMRPAFRNAGLPPMAAATAVLALLFSAVMVLLSGDGSGPADPVAGMPDSKTTDLPFDHRGSGPGLLLDLGLVGLALSGTALLAKGLMQGAAPGFGLRLRRWMAGLGAYAFHAGTGLIAFLALRPADPAAADEAALQTGLHWTDQTGTIAGALLFAGAGLVVLALLLALLRRLRRN
ncbi:hypothetical protein [Szabonella alba]|uniref:Uncharacterized protein n=1 Tax=Szabonella alba TaxID=2804194 RepID=A0A8K0VE34_9RHOB|nr:hypothetical protein [Szabonella alba]MBL4917622.1 hypothetical protein [Szabonella alba]